MVMDLVKCTGIPILKGSQLVPSSGIGSSRGFRGSDIYVVIHPLVKVIMCSKVI